METGAPASFGALAGAATMSPSQMSKAERTEAKRELGRIADRLRDIDRAMLRLGDEYDALRQRQRELNAKVYGA
jgi:hypothetical protein